MKARIKPASHEELAGLMARLWRSGVPCPDEATIAEWFRLLDGIPADVMAGAFDELARTYQWPSPPKVADAMKYIRPEMDRRSAWLRKLETAQLRARLESKQAKPPAPKLRDQPQNEIDAFLSGLREKYPEGFGIASAEVQGGMTMGDGQ